MKNKGGIGCAVSYRNARDVVFLGLRDTVICTECELISYNHSSRCLSCGSLAVLNLSRVLGGSLRGQQTARLVSFEEIRTVVGDVLRGMESCQAQGEMPFAEFEGAAPEHDCPAIDQSRIPLVPLQAGAVQACNLTGANGAAVGVTNGRTVVCRARAGTMAPDLGAEAPQQSLTAICLRNRQLWRCDDLAREPRVNQNSCRNLGASSMVIAPILIPQGALGVVEVFSASRSAFDNYNSVTVQLVACALGLVILRGVSQRSNCKP